MRVAAMALFVGGLMAIASLSSAQPPGGGRGGERSSGKTATVDEMVARLMKYDANKDGKLTKEELNDPRLDALFDRADKNKDGFVTKEELTEFFTKEAATLGSGGMGGPGGPGGGFAPPQPGQILPPLLQDRLALNEEQKKQIAALQKEVDAKLEALLTEEQKKTLREMRDRGPGGFPGGPPRD